MSRTPDDSSSWNAVIPSKRQRPQLDPVDIRALEYVSPFDHNLMCAICYCPFVNAVRIPCEHVFCQRCLNVTMKLSGTGLRPSSVNCPSCRRTTQSDEITPMPKILDHMLDELLVRCPLKDEGCNEQMQRCEVQHHVDKRCAFSEVQCPAGYCMLSVLRKDTEKQRCLHNMLECEDCNQSMMERDLGIHRSLHCEAGRTSCPDCKAEVLLREIGQHVESCPDAIFPCTAAKYGCDFIGRRVILDQHSATCALLKLGPFLQKQDERINAHALALKTLRHKNSILETSLLSFQETLSHSADIADASTSSTSVSNANAPDSAVDHLLCLHESLREELDRVSAALSEIDARTTMTVMNESLRTKEDMSRMNAAIVGIRSQLNQQRRAIARDQTGGVLNVSATAPAECSSGDSKSPIRRLLLSDSARQYTKL